MTSNHHEILESTVEVPQASNRSVGIVLACVFGMIGAWPLLNNAPSRSWALGLACGLIVLALVMPRALTPVAWLWLGLGRVLHMIVSPLILFLLYVFTVIPTGFYLKLTGKDPLRLKRDPGATSYWIKRDPPGPDPASLPLQF